MDLSRPNAKSSSGLALVDQKPEAAISIELATPEARHLLGLLLFGQKPEERSPYLSLAGQTTGMPAIGQKKEARAEPSDYQTAGWPEGGRVIFKDFAR